MSPSEAWYTANWMCLGNPNLDFVQVYSHMAMDGWSAGGGGSAAGGGWTPNWKVRAESYRDLETGRYYTRIGDRLYGYTWNTTNYLVYNKENRRAGLWGWELWSVNQRVYYSIEGSKQGGINPSITAGIAVGGGMIGGLEQSYKYGNHNVKYAQSVNGKVRAPSVLTRTNQMNATKMASGLKVVGRGVTGLSVAASTYQFVNSDMSGNDIARLSGSLIIMGTAAIPIVGPLISIGLGTADSYGAFDGIYNYFD